MKVSTIEVEYWYQTSFRLKSTDVLLVTENIRNIILLYGQTYFVTQLTHPFEFYCDEVLKNWLWHTCLADRTFTKPLAYCTLVHSCCKQKTMSSTIKLHLTYCVTQTTKKNIEFNRLNCRLRKRKRLGQTVLTDFAPDFTINLNTDISL